MTPFLIGALTLAVIDAVVYFLFLHLFGQRVAFAAVQSVNAFCVTSAIVISIVLIGVNVHERKQQN